MDAGTIVLYVFVLTVVCLFLLQLVVSFCPGCLICFVRRPQTPPPSRPRTDIEMGERHHKDGVRIIFGGVAAGGAVAVAATTFAPAQASSACGGGCGGGGGGCGG